MSRPPLTFAYRLDDGLCWQVFFILETFDVLIIQVHFFSLLNAGMFSHLARFWYDSVSNPHQGAALSLAQGEAHLVPALLKALASGLCARVSMTVLL